MPADAPTPPDTLAALYARHSKHASYQQLHPRVAALLPEGAAQPATGGRLEAERQAWFEATLPLAGADVLDIGANTGYFSFGALAAGARHVRSVEGNPDHAALLHEAGARLGLQARLEVQSGYYDFASDTRRHDIVLCLNVLHHLGDDFGERGLGIEQARARMQDCLRHLAGVTRWLVLQTGFNWKGDRRQPLYPNGLKAELVAHVAAMAEGDWAIEEVVVVDPASRRYVPMDEARAARFDALGEFMNRPLFRMRSLRP